VGHALIGAVVWGGLFALGWIRDAAWPLVVAPVGLLAHAWLVARKPLRRAKALDTPFPEAWRRILKRRVGFYEALDEAGRAHFEHSVRIILADYQFEAVAGAKLDDEIRLLAASGAAMLVHGMDHWEFPAQRTILIYPDHFSDEYQVARQNQIAGMVHQQGPIILSARALKDGFKREDGHNVAVHEFAHVLDFDDGAADGIPGMLSPRCIEPWLELMKDEMRRVKKGKSVLRKYAGTNQAELFAVAVEGFFERPAKMRRRHPELYEALTELFRLDPGNPGRFSSQKPAKPATQG
jgi:Mlc titration factor MtfA (ptsG expression regulator)